MALGIQERLKDLRAEKKLTLEQLADFYGVTADYHGCRRIEKRFKRSC